MTGVESDLDERLKEIAKRCEGLGHKDAIERLIAILNMFEVSEVGFTLLKPDELGNLVQKSVNTFYRQLTGYTAEELEEIPFVDMLHPDNQEVVRQYLDELVGGEESTFKYKAILVNKERKETPVEISTGPPFMFPHSTVPTFGLLVGDHSKIEKLEGKIRQMERLTQLATLNPMIQHSVNNAITGGCGMLGIALKDERLAQFPDLMETLTASYESMQLASHTLKEILDISKPSGDKSTVNIYEVLAGLARTYERIFEHKGIRFSLNLLGEIPKVRGYPLKIRDAVDNLLVNAYHAVMKKEEGDGVITLGARFDKYVTIQVSDNGYGIPPELHEKVFEAFYSTKGDEGTGLGLFTVRKIMEEHGGKIGIKSKEGAGSTFKLYFPPMPTTQIIKTEDLFPKK